MPEESPGLSHELLDGTLALADALNKYRLPYALIGGLAAGYRTHARFTRDVDFLLTVPQLTLPRLLEDLVPRGFTFDLLTAIREFTQDHMTVLSFHGIRIDWLKAVIPAYQHVLDRATEENWQGHPIRVASAEGLILLKLLAFRTQDQLDIENLVAAHRENLDQAWIENEWQAIAPLEDPRMRRLQELIATS
jgi:hypothetical protein